MLGLNPHLLASFWEVDRQGNPQGAAQVRAPLSQAEMEASLQWQSPFENAGAESKAPALLAMLQSGALQPVLAALNIGGADGKAQAGQASSGLSDALKTLEGRTGITKLNSTQVFVGMAPLKFNVTLVLRAWASPETEVEVPRQQLMLWALPKKLSPDGFLVNGLRAVKGEGAWVDTLMPSEAPTMIAMRYKRQVYKPLVIESIGQPLDSPIDGSGRYVQMSIPLTLATLTAWDRQDWINTKRITL